MKKPEVLLNIFISLKKHDNTGTHYGRDNCYDPLSPKWQVTAKTGVNAALHA